MQPHESRAVIAEQAIVGACLIDPVAFDQAASLVQAIDFEDRANRHVWQAIEVMAKDGEPIDAISVSARMEAIGSLDAAGGMGYLVDLASNAPAAANVLHYARQVHDKAMLRHLGRLCEDMAQKCRDREAKADELAMEAENRIHKLATTKRAVQDMMTASEVMRLALEYADSRASGEVKTVKTGLAKFDRLTGGLLRGSLTVVAARPSQGKTALGLCMAVGAVKADQSVAFFSLEMPAWQIGARMICMEGRASVQNLLRASLSDEEWTGVMAGMGRLDGTGLYIADSSSVSIPMLRAMVSRQKRTTGLDLVVVDYLQLMDPPKIDSREQQVAALSRGLKAMAKEFDVAVVVLAQLNRDAAGRKPRMSDIRESGAVEQDADLIVLIHREDKDGEPADEAELLIEKNRNGETGAIRMVWNAPATRFEDFAPAYYSNEVAA